MESKNAAASKDFKRILQKVLSKLEKPAAKKPLKRLQTRILNKNTNKSTGSKRKCIQAIRPLQISVKCKKVHFKTSENHLYYVLDTNVLIHDLRFVEKLPNMKLSGTAGSVLYLPYIVIKELDKLKTKQLSSLRLRVRCAIRLLNSMFDKKMNIKAQSSKEEAQHIIIVDSHDDSILNCCLQLKAKVKQIMLLTNDKNLRLKAKASDIKVANPCELNLVLVK